ncbi:MAG: hypothetical protein ACRD2C_27775 [Acidimicrobiales bacterium]
MVEPAAGGPTFPVGAAEALASRLDTLAADLDEAARLRVEARDGMPEFAGRHADDYRAWVGSYAEMIADYSERLRKAAGRLRDAVDEHGADRRQWFDMGQPV